MVIFSCSNLIVNKMLIEDGMKWNAHCYVHLLKLELYIKSLNFNNTKFFNSLSLTHMIYLKTII